VELSAFKVYRLHRKREEISIFGFEFQSSENLLTSLKNPKPLFLSIRGWNNKRKQDDSLEQEKKRSTAISRGKPTNKAPAYATGCFSIH